MNMLSLGMSIFVFFSVILLPLIGGRIEGIFARSEGLILWPLASGVQ